MRFKGIIPEVKMSEAMSITLYGESVMDEHAIQLHYIKKLKSYPVVSVNTSPLFKGSLGLLEYVRMRYPKKFLIRKDFIMIPRQIKESKEAGADAVLIIRNLLPRDQYHLLIKTCALFKIIPITEINELYTDVIGENILVNSRDLNTEEIDRKRAERVVAQYREYQNVIYASGENSDRVVKKGIANAVLIGTAFMKGKLE